MSKPARPLLSSRKKPRQDRSERLVQDILEAALRVLAREGARRFTTVRVAEEAGVSVGSLYQYFPNKEAILFRLQVDEWNETSAILEEILGDTRLPPLDRLRRLVLLFFRSEREEAAVRGALDDAGAMFRDAPEARAMHASVGRHALSFMGEALPSASEAERELAVRLVLTAMSAVAERITKEVRSRAEVDLWAKQVAEMLCAYLTSIENAAGKKERNARVALAQASRARPPKV